MNAQALPHLFQEELYHFSAPLVVVLPRPWDAYAAEDQKLLAKILTSVKVDINAIRIVEAASTDLGSLRMYSASSVMLFGVDTVEDIPAYQAITAQGFMVIRADDLNLLDDQKKKNLWTALRQMFGV